MREAELSIIIPVYNVEKYIRPCLESIISQSYSDYEVLLIDDGSTDQSGTICDEYAGRDNFRVFHTENQGVSHARNVGIDNAIGKYIYFIDSDDMLADSNTLRYMMSLTFSYPNEILRFRSRNLLTDRFNEADIATESRIEHIANKEHICSFAYGAFIFQFLFPGPAIEKHRFDERFSLGEDVLFLSELLPETNVIIDCDRVVYYRVLREGSAVHSDMKADYFDDICDEYSLIEENLRIVEGGSRVFEAICADQTGAIRKISRNYIMQEDNIRKTKKIIMQAFPRFLWNPWLSRKTRVILITFLINPKLFYRIYITFKKERNPKHG